MGLPAFLLRLSCVCFLPAFALRTVTHKTDPNEAEQVPPPPSPQTQAAVLCNTRPYPAHSPILKYVVLLDLFSGFLFIWVPVDASRVDSYQYRWNIILIIIDPWCTLDRLRGFRCKAMLGPNQCQKHCIYKYIFMHLIYISLFIYKSGIPARPALVRRGLTFFLASTFLGFLPLYQEGPPQPFVPGVVTGKKLRYQLGALYREAPLPSGGSATKLRAAPFPQEGSKRTTNA